MKTAAPIWCSVILPVYQGERFLETALESIAAQDAELLSRIEVIAVDDGSTDTSPSILQSWSSRIPLRIQTRNGGSNWMAATNAGLQAATGEWVCFLHQDDAWHPDRLEKLSQAIKKFPAASFFSHSAQFIDERGSGLGYWRTPLVPNISLAPQSVLPRYATQNFFSIPAPLFRRSLVQEAGFLREDLWFLSDWAFWIALIHASGSVVYLAEPLVDFRIHPDSQTLSRSSDSDDLHGQYVAIREQLRPILATYGILPTSWERASEANEHISVTLAQWSHGHRVSPLSALLSFLRLGPFKWRRFMADTRLIERIAPRLRLRKQQKRRPA